jgi:hypothetical protein
MAEPALPAPAPPATLDAGALLGDIDAWNLRRDGGWLRFTARLDDAIGPRDYLRALDGGDIVADAPGPLYGLLAIGGARRAGFNDAPPAFARHVLAPADHIGAVGLEGTARAEPSARLQTIAHATRETLLADVLLGWRAAARRGLPLFLARAETDASPTATALCSGPAMANLDVALDSLCAAAAALGKAPRLLAVGLDYSLEDQSGRAASYAAGVRALIAQIAAICLKKGLQRPVFLSVFESGTARIGAHPAVEGQWELAWSPGPDGLCFTAPAYMFDHTPHGRPTEAARRRMAQMDAHALVALSARQEWSCPLFLLAETEGHQIRVTARALADLVIDRADPFAAGPACGFALAGPEGPMALERIEIAPDDPGAVLLTPARPVRGPGWTLAYAAAAQDNAPLPHRGALRDLWGAPCGDGGAALHRWALPARLPVRQGAA